MIKEGTRVKIVAIGRPDSRFKYHRKDYIGRTGIVKSCQYFTGLDSWKDNKFQYGSILLDNDTEPEHFHAVRVKVLKEEP